MNELIGKYIDAVSKAKASAKASAKELSEKATEACEAADLAKLPKRLRQAEEKDIIVGAVIWYPEWEMEDDSRCWNIVEEVLRPSSLWKAYCAHDGSRYGLDGAFVEV